MEDGLIAERKAHEGTLAIIRLEDDSSNSFNLKGFLFVSCRERELGFYFLHLMFCFFFF